MKARRPSPIECCILTAMQEAVEVLLRGGCYIIKEGDSSRAVFAQAVLDRLRGQGVRNEELPELKFHCGPYGRTGRRRGTYDRVGRALC